MNNANHGICRWAFCAILVLSSLFSEGGHILGTSINYTYMSPNTYLVNVRWYRDCQGLPPNQQISVCYSSATLGSSNSIQLSYQPLGQYFLPGFPYWPPMPTTCVGGTATGIELAYYEGLITLPSAASDWILSYSTFPQNIGINQNFMYVSTKIDNINHPTNSSSAFSFNPTFIYCVNQQAWDNFASVDVDGDSLSYHLIPILDNTIPCPPAPFQNPVLPFNPLQSSTPVTMDSTNGSLTFTPSSVGTAMVSVRVDEFKSGALINSSTIEHVLYIVTGCIITGVEQFETANVILSPNPVNDELRLEGLSNMNSVSAEILDLSGKVLFATRISPAVNIHQFDVKNFPAGMFMMKIITEKTIVFKRFVKF